MKNRELSRQLDSLRDLIARTPRACGHDIEMQAHWAKYICVLAAGFLENSVEHVFGEFCDKSASPQVARYARRVLAGVQNPKYGRFVEILESFSADLGKSLHAHCNDDRGRGDAINSIMAHRHLIAHGEASDISLARVRDYLERSVEVIERIEELLGL